MLTQIANWLSLEGHADAEDHIAKAAQFQVTRKALITRVLRAIHRAQPAAPNAPAAEAPVTATSKPVTDLKPDVLTFHASIAHV